MNQLHDAAKWLYNFAAHRLHYAAKWLCCKAIIHVHVLCALTPWLWLVCQWFPYRESPYHKLNANYSENWGRNLILSNHLCSLRKQLPFHDATTVFPRNDVWERSAWIQEFHLQMMQHYPSSSNWLKQISFAAQPIRSTSQIWEVTCRQCRISALLSHFRGNQWWHQKNVSCFLRSCLWRRVLCDDAKNGCEGGDLMCYRFVVAVFFMMCHYIKTAASLEVYPGCQVEVFDIATFGKEIHCPTLYFELFSTLLYTSVELKKKNFVLIQPI